MTASLSADSSAAESIVLASLIRHLPLDFMSLRCHGPNATYRNKGSGANNFWTKRSLSLPLILFFTGGIWCAHFQITSCVLVDSILHIVDLSVFILHSNSESLIVGSAFNSTGQESLQIRTAIGGVVLLIAFVVSEHVNAIEVRLTDVVGLIRTALFKNHPTARLGFFASIFSL